MLSNGAGINGYGNNNYDDNNSPLRFVDSLCDHTCNKHILLLYEDAEYGRKIQFRFIKNGLLKGEHCIFSTPEDNIEFIKNEMTDNYGIDVEYFTKKKNLLHLYKITNPMNNQEGELKGFQEIMNTILADSKPPFRVVARGIPEVLTQEQILANINIERTYHTSFHNFPGYLMCPYPVDKMERKKHGKWLIDILQYHHAAIFAPKLGQGIGFNIT